MPLPLDDCRWIVVDNKLHCPNCNQPDPKKNYGDDPARWPKRNCKNSEPAKPPREIILDYLRLHPGSTIGEIVSSCSGCKDRLYDAVRDLVKSGEIRREGENPPIYFGVF